MTADDGAGTTEQAHQEHRGKSRNWADPAIARQHGLPSRRAMAAWFAASAIYAGAMIFARHADGAWAAWACGGYAATTVLLLVTTSWWIPLAAAFSGVLIAPLLWLIITFPPTGEVVVIGKSAIYLLKHGTPYLPQSLITGWRSYNPYLPLMELFGLPRSAGLSGALGDPRIWTTLLTIATLTAAFAIMSPHPVSQCRPCLGRVVWLAAVATVSPLIAFPLSVGVTDPPIIALTCLALALVSRGALLRAALVLAAACAMKTTAWVVIPVLSAMAWVRYGPRLAARFATAAVAGTGLLALLSAPQALATSHAMEQNLVNYPLGATTYKTPAQSPLPGHLVAELGTAGHTVAVALMVLVAVAFAAWILIRPPRDTGDVTVRLVAGYTVIFALDPSTRYGYFAYPLALLGWLALTNGWPAPRASRHQPSRLETARHEPSRQEAR